MDPEVNGACNDRGFKATKARMAAHVSERDDDLI